MVETCWSFHSSYTGGGAGGGGGGGGGAGAGSTTTCKFWQEKY